MLDLHALLLIALPMIHPKATKAAEAPIVLDAVAYAVDSDKGDPLTDSHEEDAVLMLLYAWRESNLRAHPKPQSRDAKAGVSCSYWQEPCEKTATMSPREQAAYWLATAKMGAKLCPESPLAPISGGCGKANRLADRRAEQAHGFAVRAVSTMEVR